VKVLIVGSGGREHAIVRALMRSPTRPELLCTPGNAGIAADARLLAIAVDDVEAIAAAAEAERVDLVVVGPEAPLVAGLVDACAARGVPAFGPTAAAARLEGSKAFAKEAMEQAGVATAAWRHVSSLQEGLDAIAELARPGVVVKADGLAAGKGVTVASSEAEGREALEEIFVQGRFGSEAVVEELLPGQELSLLAVCDGVRAVPLAPARDYKRIFDGDRGPNTGGMGSFSPVAGFDDERIAEIAARVHQPIVDLMRRRGTPFHGVLYAGLMLSDQGTKVLEFNVRFGDPETQAVLPRLRSDLLDLLLAATREDGLAGVELSWAPQTAVTVVLASAGYPAAASKGDVIEGLDDVPAGVEVTHAGTAFQPAADTPGAAAAADTPGAVVTAGGRVLNVTALGEDVSAARSAAYAAAQRISFHGMQMRGDIATEAPAHAARRIATPSSPSNPDTT